MSSGSTTGPERQKEPEELKVDKDREVFSPFEVKGKPPIEPESPEDHFMPIVFTFLNILLRKNLPPDAVYDWITRRCGDLLEEMSLLNKEINAFYQSELRRRGLKDTEAPLQATQAETTIRYLDSFFSQPHFQRIGVLLARRLCNERSDVFCEVMGFTVKKEMTEAAIAQGQQTVLEHILKTVMFQELQSTDYSEFEECIDPDSFLAF